MLAQTSWFSSAPDSGVGSILLVMAISITCAAQQDTTKIPRINFHYQLTTVTQHKFDMPAPYTGANSLTGPAENATTITSTIFLGARLWRNASFYVNPEISGGSGISGAHGVADFTNGEAFRVGNPAPKMYLARMFIRQTFSLSDEEDRISEGANQIYGKRPRKYVTVIAGKFGIADFFDANSYSHDPRSQFFNWGLMSNGGWDYPANVRGYTWGAVVEYGSPSLKIRAASVMVPTEANGNEMDQNFGQANSNALEVEIPFNLGRMPGTVRGLAFLTNAHMGNYDLAVEQNPTAPDITATRSYGRNKYGFGLNVELAVSDYMGLFARTSWNDGKNETWAFTEIDQSASLGMLTAGHAWMRPQDKLGVATVVSGISTHHRDYLAAGGLGFIIGDGALNYSREWVSEIFYNANIFHKNFFITPNYQFVVNPAYNRDRGPAHVMGVRAHVEF
jgi:high affinity Mn2+ porin